MTTPVYVLDSEQPALPDAVRVRSAAQVRQAYANKQHAVWLIRSFSNLSILTKAVTFGKPRHAFVSTLRVSTSRRALLDALFAVVVDPSSTEMLPADDLREVLSAENRHDLVIAAQVVPEDDALVLFRGDLRSLIVPLSAFKAKKAGPKPDPKRLSVTDYGQTICLGVFEIAVDALLYEFDPEARRRAKRREVATDDSLGASIRRLRLQKKLSRADFGSIAEKTIARIERGETKPRGSTLATIAKRLGVQPMDLGSF